MLAHSHISTATAPKVNTSTKHGWRQFFANLLTAFSACAW